MENQSSALTLAEIKSNASLIHKVLKEVLKKDVHFGVIPGCKKPSLWKPGSEYILMTFRLAVNPVVDDLSTQDEARFRVKTELVHIGTGKLVGSGIGEASSSEEKYRWRKAVCEEEYNDTPEDRRREKWFKPYEKPAYKVKQVRTNIADVANTILKMAKKRSQIDATLTATAASDVFEQDIEDLPEEMRPGNDEAQAAPGKPAVAMPQEKKAPGPIQAVDLITMMQGKVNDKMNVVAIVQSAEKKKVNKRDKSGQLDITEYTVVDNFEIPVNTAKIKVFAEPIEFMPGETLIFTDLNISDWEGKNQYVANKASK